MKRVTIHSCPLFPSSCGIARTDCGLMLPQTSDHFLYVGQPKPKNMRRCKRCAKAKRLKYWKWAVQKDINKKISEGLRLAWARRKAAQ